MADVAEPQSPETTTPSPPSPTSEPAAPAEDAVPEDLQRDVSTDQQGEKKVSLAAVIKERREKSQAKKELQQLQERFRQTEEALKPWMPVLQNLSKNQTLVDRLARGEDVSGPTQQQQQAQENDQDIQELAQLAQALDLYDANGQPDLQRAALIDERNRRQVEQTVAQHVGPIAQQTAIDKSTTNFNRMATMRGKSGRAVNASVLGQMWKLLPPDQTAIPEVAQVLRLAAMGHAVDNGDMPADVPKAPEGGPLVTESPSGRSAPVRLNESQVAIARELGISETDFAKGIETVQQTGRLD